MKNALKIFLACFFTLSMSYSLKAQLSYDVTNYNNTSAWSSYFGWSFQTCANATGCGESMRLGLTSNEFRLDHTNSNISPPLFNYHLWEQLEISAENREIYLNPIRKNIWNGDHANYVGDWGTVVINTYNLVPNTALTVNGATYIANPNDTSARTNAAFDPNGANKYLLKVESGVLSEDFALASVANWPDYVFSDDYQLLSLTEVQQHIAEEGHLPNVPSAEEVSEEGYSMGEMDAKLLEKVEELTLYLLEQDKQIKVLKKELESLKTAQ